MMLVNGIGVPFNRGGVGGGGASGLVTEGLILNLDSTDSSSYSGTGTVWTDLSGEGNHFDLVNGPTFSTDDGGTIVTDGANDYIKSQGNINEVNASFSAFAYVKCTNLDSSNWAGTYITVPWSGGWNNASQQTFNMQFRATTSQWSTYNYMAPTFVIKNASYANVGVQLGWDLSPVPQIEESEWYYIGFATNGQSGDDCNFYVNSVKVGTLSLTGERTPQTTKPYVLANDSWGRSFGMPGSNRNYHAYSRELSDAEVLQNYNAIKI